MNNFAGHLKPSDLRGRVFNFHAIASGLSKKNTLKSLPLSRQHILLPKKLPALPVPAGGHEARACGLRVVCRAIDKGSNFESGVFNSGAALGIGVNHCRVCGSRWLPFQLLRNVFPVFIGDLTKCA